MQLQLISLRLKPQLDLIQLMVNMPTWS